MFSPCFTFAPARGGVTLPTAYWDQSANLGNWDISTSIGFATLLDSTGVTNGTVIFPRGAGPGTGTNFDQVTGLDGGLVVGNAIQFPALAGTISFFLTDTPGNPQGGFTHDGITTFEVPIGEDNSAANIGNSMATAFGSAGYTAFFDGVSTFTFNYTTFALSSVSTPSGPWSGSNVSTTVAVDPVVASLRGKSWTVTNAA